MNAAARATIASLISAGEVERVPVDQVVVANLLRQAGNHCVPRRPVLTLTTPKALSSSPTTHVARPVWRW